jgi:hypothetical protein
MVITKTISPAKVNHKSGSPSDRGKFFFEQPGESFPKKSATV